MGGVRLEILKFETAIPSKCQYFKPDTGQPVNLDRQKRYDKVKAPLVPVFSVVVIKISTTQEFYSPDAPIEDFGFHSGAPPNTISRA
jgi:hypothetical protein